MRRLAQTLIFLFSISFLSGLAFAQTRGEGVGTLFSNTQGDTTISITDVKTAPWSEVIVENGAEEIQAVAKLDGKGRVNFTFEAESADVGNLYIYAVDEAGVTNKILITGTSLSDEVLPPTLISGGEEGLAEDSIRLTGFSYPGTTISVVLTSDRGYNQTLGAIADATSGLWEISADSLVSGNYTARARADLFGKISQESQALTFEIPSSGIIEDIVKLTEALIATLTSGVSKALENLTQFVQNLPEPIKRAADTASKAAIPLSLLGILLQAGISTLEDLLTFFNRYLFTLFRIPLFPLLLKRKKRKKPWGVLYDSFTKNPLAGGLVRLLGETGNFIDMEVTGESGAFSFVPTPGKYKLEPLKAGYLFPSQKIIVERDGEYDRIYRGGVIEVIEDQPVIGTNIPIDPREIPEGAHIQRLFRRHGPVFNLLILIGGLVLSGIAYLAAPAIYNQLIAGFYVVTLSLVTADTVKIERTWGVVKDDAGNPVEAVALSLIEIDSGRLINRRVTNTVGHYQFVAPRGRYKILIASFDWERFDQNGYYDGSEIAVMEETEILNLPIAVKKKPITALKRRETI
jgi:hypothetical protein